MKGMRIGKRTLKTALAVVLSLYIGNVLRLNNPLFAGFSAVIVMQGSVYDSVRVMKDRMLATITGAVVALLILATGYENYLTIALGIIVIILLCTRFQWKNSIALGCITFLIILVGEGTQSELSYAIHRALDTLIGLVVGFAVNFLLFPPHPLRLIIRTYREIEKDLFEAFRDFLEHEKPMPLNLIQSDLVQADADYQLVKKQRKVRVIKQERLIQLEQVNSLLFEIVSHMVVIGTRNEGRNMSERAAKKVRRILPNLQLKEPTGPLDLNDEFYSYHIERIAELLLLIREKMHTIYEQEPKVK
jgi:uncharacterized membrane protein YgaE (UPF0421/DUF939 family)